MSFTLYYLIGRPPWHTRRPRACWPTTLDLLVALADDLQAPGVFSGGNRPGPCRTSDLSILGFGNQTTAAPRRSA